MHISKILVVSLHHANADEQEKGAGCESFGPQLNDGHLIGWTLENCGSFPHRSWIARLHPDIATHDLSGFSAGLQQVLQRAIAEGATYIHFDSSKEPNPDFVDYRH